MRLPIKFLMEVVFDSLLSKDFCTGKDYSNDKKTWKFTTKKGNEITAKRVKNSIEFEFPDLD